MEKGPIPSTKWVKLTVNSHVQVMCHFNFFSSTFVLTLNRKNDAYTLLNLNPIHKNNSEVRAKVEEKNIKMAHDLHMTVDRQF
jgi:hypothetical protein